MSHPRTLGRIFVDEVTLAHGGGGKAMKDLIDDVFVRAFDNPTLAPLEDQARLWISELSARGDRLAFTTDSFVVDPLFFPGGDIGKLAVCGTVNDLAVGGAVPLFLSCAVIIEEGVSLEVEMRLGQEVTCAKLADCQTMLVSTGTITELTDYYDRGCRTQITTRVADPRGMLARWGCGVLGNDMMTLLHRVVFYGDHRQGLRDLAAVTGFKLMEEG